MNLSSSSQAKIALLLISTILVSVAVIWFLVSPLLASIQKTKLAIAKAEQDLLTVESKIQSYEVISKELVKIEQDRDVVTKIFPIREEMASLVEGLEQAITRPGLTWKLTMVDFVENPDQARGPGERPAPTVAGLSKIEEIPYKLELVGPYRGLTDFFQLFENLPYESEVSKLTITALSVQDELTKTLRNTGLGQAKIEAAFYIRAK